MSLIVLFAGGEPTKMFNHPILAGFVFVTGLFTILYRRDGKIKK